MRAARALTAVPVHAVVAVVVALVVLGPALGPGYVLSYDMVVVPRQPITGTVLGLAAMAPRAVPSDLVVASLSRLLPADLVQTVLLLALLVAAGWGAGALAVRLLARGSSRVAGWSGAAAALAYVWSPFLYERLVIGHWALLVGWSVLPWLALRLDDLAAASDRRARSGALAGTTLLVAVAALGSPAAGTGVALLAGLGVLLLPAPVRTRFARGAVVAVAAVVANGPWLVPSLLQPDVLSEPDPAGVAAFAARPDTVLGTAVSLLAGGGIWNGDVAPAGRELAATAVLVVVVLAVAAAGLPVLLRCRPVGPLLVAAGLGGWALAALLSTGPGRQVLEAVVAGVPGAGLVRDTQKLVLPTALLLAVSSAAAVAALVRRATAPGVRADRLLPAVVLVLVPVLALPSLAWGAGGRLRPTGYPVSWSQARAEVAGDDVPGTVLVLPWNLYRRYSWGPPTTVLTPLQRWFDRRTVSADDLPVLTEDGEVVVVAGEDRLARDLDPVVDLMGDPAAAAAVADGLRSEGVRYVVVERGYGAEAVDERALAELEVVVDAPEVLLLRVDAPEPVHERVPPRAAVLAALVLAALGLVVSGLAWFTLAGRRAMLLFGSRRRRPHP